MNKDMGLTYTTGGLIKISELGFTLPHEHFMVDFGGAATAGKQRYDSSDVVNVMQPYLQNLRDQGVQTFIECNPNYLGRDVEIFLTLCERKGLNIITNTGVPNNQYLPDYAHDATAERLAGDWTAEFENGIDGTGIKPGFIKSAVNTQRPLPVAAKS